MSFTNSLPICKKCNTQFDARVKRPRWVKFFLFFIPLKRYHCYKCGKKYYVKG